MTTIDKFSKFERGERVFQKTWRAILYIAVGYTLAAVIGATAVTPGLLKKQCEAQALHSGANAKDCHWETIEQTSDAPGVRGYIF
jgi:hypothetical protein